MFSEEMEYPDTKSLRNKAEEKLKTMQHQDSIHRGEADLERLVHELQVHQIELEMQNNELRQAYETAEIALKKYTLLFDLSPMGYFTLDSNGTICDLNFTAAEILQERRFSLIDTNFKLFILESSIPVFNNFLTRVYTRNAKESCQVMLGYDHNHLSTVYIEGVLIEDEYKCLVTVVDVSKCILEKRL
ncbi:MAG: hypothetical protein ACOH2V_03980 [Candidatus Saccharimonadaceae bacterium]